MFLFIILNILILWHLPSILCIYSHGIKIENLVIDDNCAQIYNDRCFLGSAHRHTTHQWLSYVNDMLLCCYASRWASHLVFDVFLAKIGLNKHCNRQWKVVRCRKVQEYDAMFHLFLKQKQKNCISLCSGPCPYMKWLRTCSKYTILNFTMPFYDILNLYYF